MMIRYVACVLFVALLVGLCVPVAASDGGSLAVDASLSLDARGAVLMEASTGTVLYEYNMQESLPPASVTKVMTMLLVMEALDSGAIGWEDVVCASEQAVAMGGSQIYLEVGEEMSVRDLVKAVAINSANDAALALAEHVHGSEEAFVNKMNERAAQLGALNTHFTNTNGLHDDAHATCAYDLALFTRELLQHPAILEFTTTWMDSLRNGTFGLANTNKMLRTYAGMTGMKTGYTKEAGHCLSGTATRNGMSLVAVVLGATDSKTRFASVAKLLDYGFANYTIATPAETPLMPIPVKKGTQSAVPLAATAAFQTVVRKGSEAKIEAQVTLPAYVDAPVNQGDVLGEIAYSLDGKVLKTVPITAAATVPKAGFSTYFGRIWESMFCGT